MELFNASEIQKDTSTYLLYANPGIGKTYTAHYLEGKTLYVPIDNSSTPLKGNENIDIVKFNSYNAWNEWNQLLKDLAKVDLSKYDTIFFDNISELVRSMLANLGRDGKNNRVPTQGDYQRIDFFLLDSIRFIQTLGKRIVFTAWETTDLWNLENGQQINRAYPDIRDKIRNNFMGLCQVVGRLTINPETKERGFILQPTNFIFAKNQLDNRKGCLQQDIFKVGDVDAL